MIKQQKCFPCITNICHIFREYLYIQINLVIDLITYILYMFNLLLPVFKPVNVLIVIAIIYKENIQQKYQGAGFYLIHYDYVVCLLHMQFTVSQNLVMQYMKILNNLVVFQCLF